MSYRDMKRGLEYQLDVLKIQLDHERETVFSSALIALGVAFVIFGLTVLANIYSSQTILGEIPFLLLVIVYGYPLGGLAVFAYGLVRLSRTKINAENAIED